MYVPTRQVLFKLTSVAVAVPAIPVAQVPDSDGIAHRKNPQLRAFLYRLPSFGFLVLQNDIRVRQIKGARARTLILHRHSILPVLFRPVIRHVKKDKVRDELVQQNLRVKDAPIPASLAVSSQLLS